LVHAAQRDALAAAALDTLERGGTLSPGLAQVVANLVAAGRVKGVTPSSSVTAPQSPVGEAQSFIAQERQRLEHEKYDFSPEMRQQVDSFNQDRAAQNAKHQAEADKVSTEMAAVMENPSLSDKDRGKKLAGLQKKRDSILKKVKPMVDLEATTRQIDTVMNDPNLTDDQKKKQIDALKKHLDLPGHKPFRWGRPGKHDGVNMHDMFTGRLGKLYRTSKNRVAEHRKGQEKELKAQLRVVEQTQGKDSVAAIQLRAQIDQVKKTHQQEEERLKKIGDTLHDMYRPRTFWESFCNFFKKIGSVIAKIVDLVMPLVKLIPGVGQIAGAIWSGVKVVGNLVTGNWKGALTSALDFIPGVGGMLGKAVGGAFRGVLEVGKKVFDYARKGVQVVGSLARGDVAGALSGAAGVVGGDVGNVLGKASQAAGAVQSLARGDVAGALSGAAGIAGGDVGSVLSRAAQGMGVVQGLSRGDVVGALAGAGSLAGGVPGLEGLTSAGSRWVRTAEGWVSVVTNGGLQAVGASVPQSVEQQFLRSLYALPLR
jgi:hypothetical protein